MDVGELFARQFDRALVGERFALPRQRGDVVGFEQQRLAIKTDGLARQALSARDLRKRYDRRTVARVGGKRRFIGVDRGVEIALRLRRLALVHQRYGLGQDIIVGTLRIGGYRQAGQNETGAKGQ